MPNYEFKCDTCGKVVELLFKAGPAPYRVTPHLGDMDSLCPGTLVRLLGKFAFILK